jgi:hypothetical protein
MYYDTIRRKQMEEIVSFLKDILMIEDSTKVGLSQYKTKPSKPVRTQQKPVETEVKLSDLMRGL